MKASAWLVVVGLVLVVAQVAGLSDGFPSIGGLGFLLTSGLLALAAGVLIGLLFGSPRYRLACTLALASAFSLFWGLAPWLGVIGSASLIIGVVFAGLAALLGTVSLSREQRSREPGLSID